MPRSKAVLTEDEEIELLALLEQEERERVAPKFEQWRDPAPLKIACGGRGAGAKSRSVSSLLVQRLEDAPIRWFCGRQIQNSLEESSYQLILDQIDRLGYHGWKGIPTNSKIINLKNGSYFYFRGIKDVKAAKNLKGLENYDGAWIDEGEGIPMDVWDILIPSFRKNDSEIWITFNRDKEKDPAYEIGFITPAPGTIALYLEPGRLDNPWFPDKLLARMEHDYATRPDIAEHIWGGKPKKQGFNSALSRVAIRAAMNRTIEAVGENAVGVDVARFGDDDSEMYRRHGLKTVDHQSYHGLDNWQLADRIWDFAGRDRSIQIVIDDTGVGGGVTDILHNKYEAKTVPVNFAQSANDKDKYIDIIAEMWFSFGDILDEADIPDDDELMDQLSERQYDYDKHGRKSIESKKDFKKRYGKSPDKSDALLLTYFTGGTARISQKARESMAARRARGR